MKMYFYDNDKDEWRHIAPHWAGFRAFALNAGEMCYYLTYGEKFYGAYEWGDEHEIPFHDSFYDKANL